MLDFLFRRTMDDQKPPYIDEICEYDFVRLVRLKGRIDQEVIPLIGERIKETRRQGETIEKNLLLDMAKVEHVDTATIAFHLQQIKEYQNANYCIAFIHLNDQVRSLLEVLKTEDNFPVFPTEKEALEVLNQPCDPPLSKS